VASGRALPYRAFGRDVETNVQKLKQDYKMCAAYPGEIRSGFRNLLESSSLGMIGETGSLTWSLVQE
jgi:hypothetical protein